MKIKVKIILKRYIQLHLNTNLCGNVDLWNILSYQKITLIFAIFVFLPDLRNIRRASVIFVRFPVVKKFELQLFSRFPRFLLECVFTSTIVHYRIHCWTEVSSKNIKIAGIQICGCRDQYKTVILVNLWSSIGPEYWEK